MHKKIFQFIICLSLILGCETNDVPYVPQAQIKANQLTIGENGDSVQLEIRLDAPTTSEVSVNLSYQGSATYGEDYSVDPLIGSIAAGDTSAVMTVIGINDEDVEGPEDITITFILENAINVGQSSVSLILDDDDDNQVQNSLVLNEVLYDPFNSGLNGDANGDGTYVQNEDEFIELVNIGSSSIDLSGYKVFDASALSSNSPRHIFPSGEILPAGGVYVLFGGGAPTGSFGGAIVSTTSTGMMNLNNSGDMLTIVNAQDSVLIQFDITPLSDNPNESYTRSPDLTGEFDQHSNINSLLFSPGTKIDGSPF